MSGTAVRRKACTTRSENHTTVQFVLLLLSLSHRHTHTSSQSPNHLRNRPSRHPSNHHTTAQDFTVNGLTLIDPLTTQKSSSTLVLVSTMGKRKPKKSGKESTRTTATPKIDIISNLPDFLLFHILSFLPTRCAMATSVLARRWRHLWKDLLVLDLDNSEESPYYLSGGRHRFVAFVDSVFAQRTAAHVEKFCLTCEIPIDKRKSSTTWLRSVVGPHLKELYLDLSLHHHKGYGRVKLPQKNLELDLDCVDPNYVICSCRALENLKLTLREAFPTKSWETAELHMPRTLKRLTLIQADDTEEDLNDIQELVINTPLLEYLSITLWARCLQVSISDYPNMVEAHLDIDQDQEQIGWVLELFKALRQTKLLDLKLSTMECLLRASPFELPEFSRLVNLELEIPYFDSGFMIELLHNCNMLQVLTLHNREKVSTLELEEPNCWKLPMKDPDCVISHLKIFEFKGYQDSADEHAFVAYLLERGPILETMKIHADPSLGRKYKQRIHKELSRVPRSSKTCQLKVT
ncbi:putative FBD-associated F-box protein At5g38570 isoform X2 [Arachis ipaensis]|uniref:putative FBD-associated F-box protein At5g38570 isoform X2 n=1 Tax=Arachis ipaensis TaxID=130454 RepID=UPI000A2B5FE7|nr:putative FBD-associated F-box protein At5g38570 isoform X2 [Arachis ipaensis]